MLDIDDKINIELKNSGYYQCPSCRYIVKDGCEKIFYLYELESHLLDIDDNNCKLHEVDLHNGDTKYHCFLDNCGDVDGYMTIGYYKRHIKSKEHIKNVKGYIEKIEHDRKYDKFLKELYEIIIKKIKLPRGGYIELKKFYGIYIKEDDNELCQEDIINDD